MYMQTYTRVHPFNMKGGGLWFFGKTFSLSKFDGEKYFVSEMGRKNILKALYALKNCFGRKKIMLLWIMFLLGRITPPPPPPPFKLNGCSPISLIDLYWECAVQCILLPICLNMWVPLCIADLIDAVRAPYLEYIIKTGNGCTTFK